MINRQFTTLYDEVMEQYMKELSALHGLFDQHKAKPLIYENYPPTAGAIAWASAISIIERRNLFSSSSGTRACWRRPEV